MERLNDHRHVHARVIMYIYLIFVMTGGWRQRRAYLHQSDVH